MIRPGGDPNLEVPSWLAEDPQGTILAIRRLYRFALEVQPNLALNPLLPHPLPSNDEIKTFSGGEQ